MIFNNEFKDFYPKWYRDKKEIKFRKRNVRYITYLLIANLLLAPNLIFMQNETLKDVTKDMLDKRKNISCITQPYNNEFSKKIKELEEKGVKNYSISNGEFVFEIEKEKFNKDFKEYNNSFKIKSVQSLEESKEFYKVKGEL